MKIIRKSLAVLLVLLILLSLVACKSEEKKEQERQAALQKQVEETLAGAWEYREEFLSKRYIFVGDTIEQNATGFDENGKATDLSLGNILNIHFVAVSENEIQIHSGFGEGSEDDPIIRFEKIDEDTLQFDGSTYKRFTGFE